MGNSNLRKLLRRLGVGKPIIMLKTRFSKVVPAAALLTLWATSHVDAQVLYNTLTQNGEQLRQVNSNGSNNFPIQIGNLPQAANPAVSRDGRLLSVRSMDPGRPNTFSTNVHVLDSANGQLRKITNFADSTDPQSGATFNHSPRYTAFSPDGTLLAVSDFLNTQTAGQGSSTTNFTSIYRVSDGELVEGPTIIGSSSTQSTVGVGISWSPANNLVAIPATAQNGATAIIGGNSLAGLPAQQITFPQVGVVAGGNFVEDDSFPSFSPNGQALAYFRSHDVLSTSGQQSFLSLRITSPGGDRSIFDFNPGFQPIGLSWSPDGTQLAAGIAQQLAGGGTLFNLGDPSASQVVIFNANGSGIAGTLASPGFSPAWSSLQQSSQPGDFDNDGNVDGRDFLFWQRHNSPNQGNAGDLAVWKSNFGRNVTLAAEFAVTAAVPEPTTALLLLVAMTLCGRSPSGSWRRGGVFSAGTSD